MKPRNTENRRTRFPFRVRSVFFVAFVGLIVLTASSHFFGSGDSGSNERDRKALHDRAVEEGRTERQDWADTPEKLIFDFWDAASRRDYDRLVLLAPGSKVEDFKKYYDQWTPSPAKSVG